MPTDKLSAVPAGSAFAYETRDEEARPLRDVRQELQPRLCAARRQGALRYVELKPLHRSEEAMHRAVVLFGEDGAGGIVKAAARPYVTGAVCKYFKLQRANLVGASKN